MPSHNIDRISENIRRELTAIFRELKDPRIHDGLISIVRVETSKDLSYCKVYISAMDGMEKAKKMTKILKIAQGHIRHELANRLDIRQIPLLTFVPTDSIEYSASISKLLDTLKED